MRSASYAAFLVRASVVLSLLLGPGAGFAQWNYVADVLESGIGFLIDYKSQDVCLNAGERVAETARKRGTLGAVGLGTVAGLGTLAITGSPLKGLAAAAIGGAVGGLAGQAMGSGARPASANPERARDFELCRLAASADALIQPSWDYFVSQAPTSCALSSNQRQVTEQQLRDCIIANPNLVPALQHTMSRAYDTNVGACEAGKDVWNHYNSRVVASLAASQSYMPYTGAPSCNGIPMRVQYPWIYP